MRYYLSPVLLPATPDDACRLALADLPRGAILGYSAVIPTYPNGLPQWGWGLAYVASENWAAVDADARLVRLFQGEESNERSFEVCRDRLLSVQWQTLSLARRDAISRGLRLRGVPATIFQDGSLWSLLHRVGRYLDPNFDPEYLSVNRGVRLARPDPQVGYDTFTEGANTALTSHTPDVGAGWSVSGSTWTVVALTDTLTKTTGAADRARKGDDIGSDQMDVTADMATVGTTGIQTGVCGRMTTADYVNQYEAYLAGDGLTVDLALDKVVSGTRTSLGTFDLNALSLAVVSVKLEVRTAAKKVYAGGVERITTADNSLTGQQYAGVTGNGASATRNWDNFLSESVGAPQRTLVGVGV